MRYEREYIVDGRYRVHVIIVRRGETDVWDLEFPRPGQASSHAVMVGSNLNECTTVTASMFRHMELQLQGFCAGLGAALQADIQTILSGGELT